MTGLLHWFMGPPERLPLFLPRIGEGDALLLSAGGLLWALRAFPEGERLFKKLPDGVSLYLLDLDLELRGLSREAVREGIEVIGMGELFALLRRLRVVTWS